MNTTIEAVREGEVEGGVEVGGGGGGGGEGLVATAATAATSQWLIISSTRCKDRSELARCEADILRLASYLDEYYFIVIPIFL